MGALVRRRIGIGEVVGYWVAQVVGGVVAGVPSTKETQV